MVQAATTSHDMKSFSVANTESLFESNKPRSNICLTSMEIFNTLMTAKTFIENWDTTSSPTHAVFQPDLFYLNCIEDYTIDRDKFSRC